MDLDDYKNFGSDYDPNKGLWRLIKWIAAIYILVLILS